MSATRNKIANKIKGAGIVIGLDGIPKVDRPSLLEKEVWDLFSDEHKMYINSRADAEFRRYD